MPTKPRGRAIRQAACEALEDRQLLSTIYVDASSPGPTHNGTSWGNAYADLQLALGAAVSGDTINVADGTYKPASGTDRTISFQLKTGVGIYGGYAGYGAGNPDARDVTAYATILSGDIGVAGDSADNSYHVVVGSDADSTAILDGFTITAGNANGTSPDDSGGGMLNSSGNATLVNCTFIGNSAYSKGGAIYDDVSCSPALANCMFIGDTAYYGGAVYNDLYCSPTLSGCTFSSNWAAAGGAMYDDEMSSPRVANCIIWSSGQSPIFDNSSAAVITCSDIQGGCAGIGNINTDPMFVRSPWTGPDGLFGTADDDYDLHLRYGSPALDVGSNAAIPLGVTTDLAGNARIQDDVVDIGAYEGAVCSLVSRNIYVDLAAVGANNGVSWNDAFTSLQTALLVAADGDTIRMAHGIYKPTSTGDRAVSFALRNAVAIYGGYTGFGALDPNARDTGAYPTILSGDVGTNGEAVDNSYHVLTTSGVNILTVIDGVTVSGGNADGSVVSQSS
jgi:hypothetical protein